MGKASFFCLSLAAHRTWCGRSVRHGGDPPLQAAVCARLPKRARASSKETPTVFVAILRCGAIQCRWVLYPGPNQAPCLKQTLLGHHGSWEAAGQQGRRATGLHLPEQLCRVTAGVGKHVGAAYVTSWQPQAPAQCVSVHFGVGAALTLTTEHLV